MYRNDDEDDFRPYPTWFPYVFIVGAVVALLVILAQLP